MLYKLQFRKEMESKYQTVQNREDGLKDWVGLHALHVGSPGLIPGKKWYS